MSASKLDDDPEVVERPDAGRGGDGDDDGGDDDDDVSTSNDSNSESDEEEDDDDDIPKRTKKRFDRILSDLRSCAQAEEVKYASLDLTDRQDLQTFLDQNAVYLASRDPKDMNLLHWIAEAEKDELPPARKMKSLITALVRLPGNLLADRDDNGKTPLLCAITNRHHRLAKIMCEAHSDANSILRIPKSRSGKQSSNCLHQALVKKASSKDDDLIKFLIAKAGADTLCARDENGLTPLHLAVEYKRCDEAQFQVVQALVKKCDQALDETYKHPEKGPLSPYRYLELTHAEAKQKEKSSARKEKIEAEAAAKNHTTKDYYRDIKGDRVREMSRDRAMTDMEYLRRTAQALAPPVGKFASRLPPGRGRGPFGQNNSLEGRRTDDVIIPLEEDKKTDKEKKPSSKRSKSSRLMPTDASVEAIKQYLKLHYLRERDHDAAVEFLYGVQQDRQIYFDLVGIDPKISKGRITSGLTHLAFEDVLQYVAIPRIEVEEEPVRLKPGQRAPKPDGKGRTDMKPLFAWLREHKKVKTVLRVIVDDLQEPAHSDEAIESCLAGFGVEIWDWKKRDLSPEVIQAVAPNARVVHLYWGGNNAVLRAWSEPEGLKKLSKLETVHLHVQQDLESRARIKHNVAEFKKRMGDMDIRETKLQSNMTDGTVSGADAAREPFERHKWMTSMEEFADFLHTAERHAVREPPLSLRYPVTVAIIDDGVDINEPAIQSKIVGGRSFCRRDEEQNLNQPYYVSGGGHGTAMARFISKLCPNVKLVILRLDEYVTGPGKRQITAKSAAKAVRTAIEKKVDIICMAWTIEQVDSNREDIKALSSALGDAAAHNILMFCAATDQGAFKDNTYPAAAPTSNIFKIGAAEASGNAMKWLGDQTRVDFIFPGHQVVVERHDDSRAKKSTALTGSSVATALASGLAAVILYCVQLAGTWRDAGRPDEFRAYKSLKNHVKMKEAFSQIGTTKESENKYITVWNRFSRFVKKAENEIQAKDMWIDIVAQLADDLMREA